MKQLIKPAKLNIGDTIATISPSWGCAGTSRVKWQYKLGVQRLEEMGLNVIAAPNSLKGTSYLDKNPEARADDIMWAFANKSVKAIIANIGGNDSIRLLPYLDENAIADNPKILCGYSDVMTLHLYCNQIGLSTFYGDNLLTTVAEAERWHPYSKEWFRKTLFDSSPIGNIPPSAEWSYDNNHHTNPKYKKTYIKNSGYVHIQGDGIVKGRLFGGHGGISEHEDNDKINIDKHCFENCIFFFEDIPEVCDVRYIGEFFDWLGKNGYLHLMNGIIIGKMRSPKDFTPFADKIKEIVSDKYGLRNLPIIYGLNFGHSSPIFVLPYGAMAEIDCDNLSFSILESGVI